MTEPKKEPSWKVQVLDALRFSKGLQDQKQRQGSTVCHGVVLMAGMLWILLGPVGIAMARGHTCLAARS